jgi:alkanesulfonate monooxygenase
MAIKTLWYLNLADGDYPWMEGGLYRVDFDRYRRLAEAIDEGGFFGALVATWPNDPFISASFAASYTKRMRFLVAVYARITPAKLLAQQALTFDKFTGGRLLLNLINGRDNIMSTYGVATDHDNRYKLGEAYWRDFARFYKQGNPANFPNTPLSIDPSQEDGIPLWGAGDSPAGVAHAGALIDGYLTMLRNVSRVKAKFSEARLSAQSQSRTLSDMGALASVVVRRTKREAEEHFYAMFQRTGIDQIKSKLDAAVIRRTAGEHTLSSFDAPDPQRRDWIRALLSDRLPCLEELQLEHALYAGVTAWSPLDIFDVGSSAVYFVGDPDTIADNVKLYHDEAGLSALILSGWPLTEEANNVAALLIPRLNEIV